MSKDFLSQDEVDALLKGVNGETDEPAAEEADPSGVRPYNLGTQERIVRGRMPTLELINERFARLLRVGLFNFIRKNAEISVGQVRVLKYGEFMRNLPVPTNLNMVQMLPLRGTALMVFDPNLVFLVIDNLFGGDGRFHTRVEGRDFTPTEQRMIQSLLDVVFAEYEKAWQPVHKIKFEFLRSEVNTQFVNIATPSEVVIAVTFTIEFSGASGEFHFCMPYSMIEPIRDRIYSTMQSEELVADTRWISLMRRQVKDAEIELVARLGGAEVTLGQVASMQVGDVITLDIPPLIVAQVDGVDVLEGSYGVANGQYALKVNRMLASPSSRTREEAANA
jgi:flagellar motor switch protein FliM